MTATLTPDLDVQSVIDQLASLEKQASDMREVAIAKLMAERRRIDEALGRLKKTRLPGTREGGIPRSGTRARNVYDFIKDNPGRRGMEISAATGIAAGNIGTIGARMIASGLLNRENKRWYALEPKVEGGA